MPAERQLLPPDGTPSFLDKVQKLLLEEQMELRCAYRPRPNLREPVPSFKEDSGQKGDG